MRNSLNGSFRISVLWIFVVICAGICSVAGAEGIYHEGWIDLNKNSTKDLYEDPARPTGERVEDLLGRMTTEEKTMQLVTLYGYGRVMKETLPTESWNDEIWKDGLANIDEQHNGVAKAEGQLDWPASVHTKAINDTQKWFIEETRLGIPVDFTNEGIRGICHTRATNFPSQLAVGAAWDRGLTHEIGRVTGKEGYLLGYTNVYSPILDVARDPRWGRMVECYGESPFLVAEMGIQQAQGLREGKIGVTSKHFAVYGVPVGGREGMSRVDPRVGPREMELIHLYPFERVIREVGLDGVMSSYNDWDGEPISGSSKFLIEILRKRMGFSGYVVSDSDAVLYLNSKHRVEADYQGSVRRFIESGGNVRTTFNHPENFVRPLRKAIVEGQLSMDVVNQRVADVLRFKFEQGLFDDPYRDPEAADKIVSCPEHKTLALRAARESVVLLKNENNILPLNKGKLKRILVTGPNAEDEDICRSRYGPKHGEVINVLEGIREFAGDDVEVVFKKGCNHYAAGWPQTEVIYTELSESDRAGILEAVNAAKDADLVIAVLGDSDNTVGENRSRTTLDLPPLQQRFIRQLHAAGKPVVVVLLTGRAATINWIQANCPAIVEGWFGGEFLGQAVAEVLFGEYNPGGKLPVTFPRTVGQVPLSFPFKPGSYKGQWDRDKDPEGVGRTRMLGELYPFGYGLSYTSFAYAELTVAPESLSADKEITVKCSVTNTGKRAGDEVVQLYVSDLVSDVTVYEKVLRGFERIHLEPGETKQVIFNLAPPKDFRLIDRSRNRVVEPGEFDIMIGASSRDIQLTKRITITGNRLVLEPAFWDY